MVYQAPNNSGYQAYIASRRQARGNDYAVPIAIDVNSNSDVYVVVRWGSASYPHEVLQFDSTGALQDRFGSKGTTGNAGEFTNITGVCIDNSDEIYVADNPPISGEGGYQRFSTGHTYQSMMYGLCVINGIDTVRSAASSFIYTVSAGSSIKWEKNSTNAVWSAVGVASDADDCVRSSDYVYVAKDTPNGYVCKVEENSTGLIDSWWYASTEVASGGAAGIDVNSNNKLLVGRSYSVRQFTTTGGVEDTYGSSGDGELEFNGISGLAVDTNDNIYVTDAGNRRIQKLDSTGGFVCEWSVSV